MTVISRSSVGGHSRQSESAVASYSRQSQSAIGRLAVALFVGLALAVLPGGAMQPAKSTLVYIGTYTGAKSKGIYVSRLDLSTGHALGAGSGGGEREPEFPGRAPGARLPLRGERDRDLRRQTGRVGQRLRHQPRHGRAVGLEPAVVDGRRPSASDRRPRRPQRAGGELWRWKCRGPADRFGRRVEDSYGLHPAHGFERQPCAPEAAVRAFGQRRFERSIRLRRGPRHRQGHDLPPRRGQRHARGQRPAICCRPSPVQGRVTSPSTRKAASRT